MKPQARFAHGAQHHLELLWVVFAAESPNYSPWIPQGFSSLGIVSQLWEHTGPQVLLGGTSAGVAELLLVAFFLLREEKALGRS